MDDVVVSLPLTDVERRILAMLGTLRPDGDGGLAIGLLSARVQALRDGGGLGQEWDGDVRRGLEIADDILCLLLAAHPAPDRDAVVERAHLFSRHRGRSRCRVSLFTASALEADRRRLGLRRRELA